MAGGRTAETSVYKVPAMLSQHDEEASSSAGGSRQRASYTPAASVDEHGFGKDGGRANLQGGSVPEVVVGGASEVGVLPGMPGTLRIGDDKNVSTPVSG